MYTNTYTNIFFFFFFFYYYFFFYYEAMSSVVRWWCCLHHWPPQWKLLKRMGTTFVSRACTSCEDGGSAACTFCFFSFSSSDLVHIVPLALQFQMPRPPGGIQLCQILELVLVCWLVPGWMCYLSAWMTTPGDWPAFVCAVLSWAEVDYYSWTQLPLEWRSSPSHCAQGALSHRVYSGQRPDGITVVRC